MNRIEMNVQTGEQKVVELTAAEISELEMRSAAEIAAKAAIVTISPVDKLKAFLSANPDVTELIK